MELQRIDAMTAKLEQQFDGLLVTEIALSRGLVSFQANKSRAVYRWYKFKEAFSAGLVEYLLHRFGIKGGQLLDPFAGSGTSLFASSALGMDSVGIELLPIGQRIIDTKKIIDDRLSSAELKTLSNWAKLCPWKDYEKQKAIPELRITSGAYSEATVISMGKFLARMENESANVASVLLFAVLCILEEISFTRKDGQYLRWDYRSGRRQGKKQFDKGRIPSFDDAMAQKLRDIVADLSSSGEPIEMFPQRVKRGAITLQSGSCLTLLPKLPSEHFDCVITSPPYCNRYDYTRTYALELALLGVDEKGICALRQDMLSCTVENRHKNLLGIDPNWLTAIDVADKQELLQSVLSYLMGQKQRGILNNNGIPRMIRGYFYEMACVIQECGRVLKSGAPLIMVNDNVRYAGASIAVDLILSDIALNLGFEVENVMVLPKGKGNSSQQMGAHGRDALRKCVYIWRKV